MHLNSLFKSLSLSLTLPLVTLAFPANAHTNAAEKQRIVTLGSAVGEIISSLGHEEQIVAVDVSCTWPETLLKKPKVGYHRQISAEGVLALKPTLVIATGGSGPTSALEQIKGAGVKVITLDPGTSSSSLITNITTVGLALGEAGKAADLAMEIEEELKLLQKKVAEQSTGQKPRVLFVMNSGSEGSILAAGKHTAADEVIHLAGGINVFSEASGYKPLSQESLANLKPDLILLPGSSGHGGGRSMIVENVALKASPAVIQGRVHEIDLAKFLGFGVRLPEAVRELQSYLLEDSLSAGL